MGIGLDMVLLRREVESPHVEGSSLRRADLRLANGRVGRGACAALTRPAADDAQGDTTLEQRRGVPALLRGGAPSRL